MQRRAQQPHGYESAVQARIERLAHYSGLEEFRAEAINVEDDEYWDGEALGEEALGEGALGEDRETATADRPRRMKDIEELKRGITIRPVRPDEEMDDT